VVTQSLRDLDRALKAFYSKRARHPRFKMIKRQMYGRAGFELLKARVLPFEPAVSS
jgi:transposase